MVILKVDFQKEDLSNIPETEIMLAYKHMTNLHLHYLKQQTKLQFLYWKVAGMFFLFIILSLILQSSRLFSNFLIGIIVAGIACLIAAFTISKKDFECNKKIAACVEKGLHIEKMHDYLAKLFSIFEDYKFVAYHGNLLSRLFPMGLIGLATGGAATLLSMKIEAWLAVAVAVFSIIVLYIGTRSYIKTTRKILLGN
jgi:hypothetical protein